MEQLLNNISTLIWSLVGTGVLALFAFFGRRLSKWHTEHIDLVEHLEESEGLKGELETLQSEVEEIKRMQEPQNAILRELMGIQLDKEHKRLVEQGYASPAEKQAFERMYKPYHGNGGNGTRTASYEDVMKMKNYAV